MDSWSLRLATSSDVDTLLGMAIRLADFHNIKDPYWNSGEETRKELGSQIQEELADNTKRWLVAEIDERSVGFFSAEILDTKFQKREKRVGNIANAYVEEEYRGKGIAKAAFAEFCTWFKEHDVRVAELSAIPANIEGVKAWEALGFREYSLRMRREM